MVADIKMVGRYCSTTVEFENQLIHVLYYFFAIQSKHIIRSELNYSSVYLCN